MALTLIAKAARSVAFATGLVLLLFATAMQTSGEMNWGPGDFVVAAVLIFGSGMLYAVASQLVKKPGQRVLIAVAVALGLAIVWAELAVGLFH
jgi:hypothetical protein